MEFEIKNGELLHVTDVEERVAVPAGVISIGEGAFRECKELKEIAIPSGVKEIGVRAFCDCESLEKVTLPGGLEKIGDRAFRHCAALKEIAIPSGVKEIGEGAFYDCTSLERLELPEGLEDIGGWAFAYCSSLQEIKIPSTVVKMGESMFAGCSSIKNIYFPESVETGKASTRLGSFEGCSKLERIVIPSGVVFLYDFIGCTNLKEVVLGEGIEYIADEQYSAFLAGLWSGGLWSGLESIEEVVLPASLNIVGKHAFAGCTSLKRVTAKGKITGFASTAFQKCPALQELYIPKDQAEAARLLFGKKIKLFTLEGEPIADTKPGKKTAAAKGSAATDAQEQEIMDIISGIIMPDKLHRWAIRKNIDPSEFETVKYAEGSKNAPEAAGLFILYAYTQLIPDPKEDLMKELAAVGFSSEADAVAAKLDRASLLKAMEKVRPILQVDCFDDECFVNKIIPIPYDKKFENVLEEEEEDYGFGWRVSVNGGDRVRPFCRYADEQSIKALIHTMNNLMKNWDRGGKKLARVIEHAILLSDTPAAMEFAEKKRYMSIYAEMRGTTPDALRKAAVSNTGLNADGSFSFDL